MSIISKYEDIYNNLMNGFKKTEDTKKISGNISSHFFKNMIEESLPKNLFSLSNVNSYIKGCGIEWDLLILNNPSEEEIKYNIYSPKSVVCALEFKTSGAIYGNNPKASCDYIKKYIDILNSINEINNSNIKYAYISFCEYPINLEAMKKMFGKNCFWIYEGYYPHNNYDKKGIKNLDDISNFLRELLE